MLINNNPTFNLDAKTTPAILWGSLVPSEDFNDSPLISSAVGTLYVSLAVAQGDDCSVTPLDATLWQKVADSRDSCGGLSQSSDWKSFSFQFSTGTDAPSGNSSTFCQLSVGSFYLQNGATCSKLWLKAYGNCDDADWVDLSSPGQCAVIGYGCPDETVLADQGLGTFFVDERSEGYVVYVKLKDEQNGEDWWCTNGLSIIHWNGSPEGVINEDLECMPVGAVLYDYSITAYTSLWVKMTSNDDGYDWHKLSSRPNIEYYVRRSTGAAGYTLQYETLEAIPNSAAHIDVSIPVGGTTWVDYHVQVTFANTDADLTGEDFGDYAKISVRPQTQLDGAGWENPVPFMNQHDHVMMSGTPFVTVPFSGRLGTLGGTLTFDLFYYLEAQNSATGAADIEVSDITIQLFWDEE